MAYIGKQPVVGNFQKCDAISVVNGQAAYSLTVGSSAVTPENVNHMLVSLNGVLQAPGDSFTVSGSTLTFASNLATGDVIDFVIILGDVLDLGTPSDNSITTAKLASDAVTEAKIADDAVESEHLNNNIISGQTALAEAPADTDEFLVSDGGTIKRIDYSHIKGGGQKTLLSTTTVSSSVSAVDITSNIDSTYARYEITVDNFSCVTHAASLRGRFFTSGSVETSSNYRWIYQYEANNNSDTARNRENSAGDYFQILDEVREVVAEPGHFVVNFYSPSDSNAHTYADWIGTYSRDEGQTVKITGAAQHLQAQAQDGFRFYMSSGNIDSGVFKLYGIT